MCSKSNKTATVVVVRPPFELDVDVRSDYFSRPKFSKHLSIKELIVSLKLYGILTSLGRMFRDVWESLRL